MAAIPYDNQVYKLTVTLLEAKQLASGNKRVVAEVRAGKQTKSVKPKTRFTDSPYFNEYLEFSFHLPLQILLTKMLKISVYEVTRCLVRRKLLGNCTIEMGTIWAQFNHLLHHKWVELINPKDPMKGSRGYILCDVMILGLGDIVTMPQFRDIEANIDVVERQAAKYVVNIYRGDGLESRSCKETKGTINDMYISVNFGGISARTKSVKNDNCPQWNQQLTFLNIFPPYFKYIIIQLRDKTLSRKHCTVGTSTLDMDLVSHDGDKGFTPSFGPHFVYFYGPCNVPHYTDYSFGDTISRRMEEKVGTGLTYKGRVLLSLKTELLETAFLTERQTKEVEDVILEPVPEIWNYEEHTMVCTIFNLLILEEIPDKHVNLMIKHGPTKRDRYKDDTNTITVFKEHLASPSQKLEKCFNYRHVPIQRSVPCLFVIASWPNLHQKIHNMNNIISCLDEFDRVLAVPEKQAAQKSGRHNKDISQIKVQLRNIQKRNKPMQGSSLLEKERIRCLKYDTQQIIDDIQGLENLDGKNDLLENCKRVLRRYSSDPETPYPDLEIRILSGESIIAQATVDVRTVIFSQNKHEVGRLCGKVQTVNFFKKKNLFAVLDVMIWFGVSRDIEKYLSSLPIQRDSTDVPLFFNFPEEHTFQCKVHILQARLKAGLDHTGLSDLFVRVLVNGKNQNTRTIEQTNNPVWSETLLVTDVILYGSPDFVKSTSVRVLVEVLDQDPHSSELVGRVFTKPVVHFTHDKYTSPVLKWYPLYLDDTNTGDILMESELIEYIPNSDVEKESKRTGDYVISIPEEIHPHLSNYRFEVLFWGLRGISSLKILPIKRVVVYIECGEREIASIEMQKAHKYPNFKTTPACFNVQLPVDEELTPMLTIKLYQIKSFGRREYLATNATSIGHLLSREAKTTPKFIPRHKLEKEKSRIFVESTREKKYTLDLNDWMVSKFLDISKAKKVSKPIHFKYNKNALVKHDWWTKYYASKNMLDMYGKEEIASFIIFNKELESESQFSEFQDMLVIFPLTQGKANFKSYKRNGESKCLKCAMKIYKYGTEMTDPKKVILADMPSNYPIQLIVRVYIISAYNLACTDVFGKTDPYLIVSIGSKKFNDRHIYLSEENNPVFGKCFEFSITFPFETLLKIRVMDHDMFSSDDIIGETVIDLENRFYSRHRATCGLSQKYESSGYNKWRDSLKPTQILNMEAKQRGLSVPTYTTNSILLGGKKYKVHGDKENQALSLLHELYKIQPNGCHLVPEHLETRTLSQPDKSGIEQGKIELWVDMFRATHNIPPRVDITPRSPLDLELRVTVWNTSEVPLIDKSFFNKTNISDIYIKGWLSTPDECQNTDVHYGSMNGEGNFNWRFIFRFKYISGENKILEMSSQFTKPEKIPCKLELQVWDNNSIDADDFIGALSLNLTNMPRGAVLARRCSLSMLEDKRLMCNLLATRRVKGWWPFRNLKTSTRKEQYELCGKVEMELELLTSEEADKNPAGLGRDNPQPLPPPTRPDSSFSWFFNPLKALKFLVCGHLKLYALSIFFIALVILFLGLFFYAIPGYVVKKILNA